MCGRKPLCEIRHRRTIGQINRLKMNPCRRKLVPYRRDRCVALDGIATRQNGLGSRAGKFLSGFFSETTCCSRDNGHSSLQRRNFGRGPPRHLASPLTAGLFFTSSFWTGVLSLQLGTPRASRSNDLVIGVRMPPKPPAALWCFGQEHPGALGKSGIAGRLGDEIGELAHNRDLLVAIERARIG